MNQSIARENGYQARVWSNTRRLALSGIAWVGTCGLMGMGPKFIWDKASILTPLAAGLNVAFGIGLILAHKKYITGLDELQQKVYFNALAITVGVVLIVSIPWSVMNTYQVTSFKPDVPHLCMLMSLTYVVSVLYGNWRYR